MEEDERFYKYKDYLVFKDATLSFPFEPPRDCVDGVTGECIKNISKEECMDLCQDHKEKCGGGYYIKNNGESWCIPLRTFVYPDSNLLLYVEPKDEYFPNYVNSDVFIDETKFEFPPDNANAVFFKDKCTIVGSGGLRISNPVKNETIKMDKNGDVICYIFGRNITLSSEFCKKVRVGDEIAFTIEESPLIMSIEDEKVIWKTRFSSWIMMSTNLVEVEGNGKKIGDALTYGDEFKLKQISENGDTKYVNIDENNELIIDNEGMIFKLEPLVDYNVCDGTECVSVNYDELDIDNEKARYKGKIVFRDGLCFACDEPEKIAVIWWAVGIVSMLLILYVLVFRLNK